MTCCPLPLFPTPAINHGAEVERGLRAWVWMSISLCSIISSSSFSFVETAPKVAAESSLAAADIAAAREEGMSDLIELSARYQPQPHAGDYG